MTASRRISELRCGNKPNKYLTQSYAFHHYKFNVTLKEHIFTANLGTRLKTCLFRQLAIYFLRMKIYFDFILYLRLKKFVNFMDIGKQLNTWPTT